jgi:hypothetical protein
VAAELNPIGSEIVKDGMIFRITGHGTNHRGEAAERVEFVGVAQRPGKAAKVREPKVSLRPPVNLASAKQSRNVGSVLKPQKRQSRKTSRYPTRQEIVPRQAQQGPPIAGVLVVLGIIVAILAWSAQKPTPVYLGPPVPITHRR